MRLYSGFLGGCSGGSRGHGWEESAVVADGKGVEVCGFEIRVDDEASCAVWGGV